MPEPGPIALPGCAYNTWVALRTAVRAVKNCTAKFSANTNTWAQTLCPGKSSKATTLSVVLLLLTLMVGDSLHSEGPEKNHQGGLSLRSF